MAGSLLNSIGLNGLIAFTHDEYERKAIDLYKNPAKLAQYRQDLAQAKENKKLFNTQVFCQEFE
jgi:predicted O-linked N-acetylglucosamine transferase (SPINDLY family)